MRPSSIASFAAVLAAALTLGAAPATPARAGDFTTDRHEDDALERALALFEKRDFRAARPLLEEVAARPDAPEIAQLDLALVSFFYADDDRAAAALARVKSPHPLAEALRVCLAGPFRPKLGTAAFLAEGRTAHYHLSTDVACDPALVAAARAEAERLGADPARNTAKLEKLRARRSRGFEEIGSLLERIYAEYTGMFKFEKDERLVSRVYVFDKRQDFLDFSARLGERADSYAGYYWPALRVLVVDTTDVGERRGVLQAEGMNTIFHEAFHQFLDYYCEDAPHWFNEGIAEYFGPSETVPGQKKLKVGVVRKSLPNGYISRYAVLQAALKPNGNPKATPLAELVRLDRARFMDPQKAVLHYAESWAFIHYLANRHPKGAPLLVAYFNALRCGEGREAAYEAAFGDFDWAKIEADWRAYLERL